jgi:hypothetical protein
MMEEIVVPATNVSIQKLYSWNGENGFQRPCEHGKDDYDKDWKLLAQIVHEK